MECTCDTGSCELHDAKAYDESSGEIQLSGSGRKHTIDWVSVKDKLPEPSDKPLLVWTRESDYPALAIFTGDTKIGQWEVYSTHDIWYTTTGSITHWMPLPEPPKRKTQ